MSDNLKMKNLKIFENFSQTLSLLLSVYGLCKKTIIPFTSFPMHDDQTFGESSFE